MMTCWGLNRTSVGLKQQSGPSGVGSGVRGLNRTSVGLKRIGGAGAHMRLSQGLNRTSVGLKPASQAPRPSPDPSLNRTSVGLKPSPLRGGDPRHAGPQSNQRGIETPLRPGGPGGAVLAASIEPAWD